MEKLQNLTMTGTHDLSIVSLISNASLLVKLIMLILLLLSIFSWFVIIWRSFALANEKRHSMAFIKKFQSATDLNELYQDAVTHPNLTGGAERIFVAGLREYARCQNAQDIDFKSMVEKNVHRALQSSYQTELANLEEKTPFLATVGSVSPYIGLFGTVWGIMNSFRALSGVTSVTLAHVAPGIAEALIATAIGLFAAIPAVLGYNYLTTKIDHIANLWESFMEDFLNTLARIPK